MSTMNNDDSIVWIIIAMALIIGAAVGLIGLIAAIKDVAEGLKLIAQAIREGKK